MSRSHFSVRVLVITQTSTFVQGWVQSLDKLWGNHTHHTTSGQDLNLWPSDNKTKSLITRPQERKKENTGYWFIKRISSQRRRKLSRSSRSSSDWSHREQNLRRVLCSRLGQKTRCKYFWTGVHSETTFRYLWEKYLNTKHTSLQEVSSKVWRLKVKYLKIQRNIVFHVNTQMTFGKKYLENCGALSKHKDPPPHHLLYTLHPLLLLPHRVSYTQLTVLQQKGVLHHPCLGWTVVKHHCITVKNISLIQTVFQTCGRYKTHLYHLKMCLSKRKKKV